MARYETVNAPGGMSYAAPLLDFSTIGDLANTFYQGKQNRRQEDIATAFPQGLPIDPRTGQVDYSRVMQVLAAKGGIEPAIRLAPAQVQQQLITQPGQVSPLLADAGAAPPAATLPAAAAPQPGVSAPVSLPAPMVNPAPGRGDQAGSVVDIVTAKLPQDSVATGAVIANLARAVGVDPNAPLNAAQSARVTQLADAYLRRRGLAPAPQAASAAPGAPPPPSVVPAPSPQVAPRVVPLVTPAWPVAPNARVAQGFGSMGPGGGASVPPASAALATRTSASAEAAPPAPPAAAPVASAAPATSAAPPAAAPHAVVPQVPLPRGFTDPQQAIMALRAEAVRIAGDTNPYHARQVAAQVKQLDDWASRIEASLAPLKIGERIVSSTGQTLYEPPTKPQVVGGNLVRVNPGGNVDVLYEGTNQLLPPETIKFMAEQYRAGDTSVLTNLGRGAQGAQNIVALRAEIARQNAAAGVSGAEQAARNAEFFGTKAGERTLGTRQANIELAATEFKQVLPVVRQASASVDRTRYPDLNRIIQAYEQRTGDPQIVAFGSGVNTLINLYARAISPTGVPTVSDKDHAREILDRAWSSGQFDAAVGMMEKEIDAALTSPAKVRQEMRERFLGGPTQVAPAAATAAAPLAPGGNWTTLPNGVRIRAVGQ